MYNARIILPVIVIILAIVTFPVWNDAIRGTGKIQPKIELPSEQKQCVMPADFMKKNHMTLLKDWRESVVRDGNRTPVSVAGIDYQKSLSGSCLKCHNNKTKFCDSCHGYLAVTPSCWDCHHIPGVK
jgi:hypothetical protein